MPRFEAVLARYANRSPSVLGLARAAAASGQMDVSRRRYSELLANFDEADGDLPSVSEARAAIVSAPRALDAPSAPASRAALVLVTTAVLAVVGLAAYVGRKKRGKRSPGPSEEDRQNVPR